MRSEAKIVKENPSPSEMLDSAFLRWWDLCKDGKMIEVPLAVEKVRMEKVFIPKANKEESRPVLTFAKTDKRLILNKTNTKTMIAGHGIDTAKWIGKTITLYVDTNVKLQGQKTNGIRIKII